MSELGNAAAGGGVEAFGYKQELKRSLSVFDLLVYGLVFIVPGAPVAVYGIVFNASKGMVPLVYFIGLIAMVFTALSYMSMARAYPVAGSVYAYAARSIGEAAGFIAGWALLLDYLLLPTLAYVVCAVALHTMLPVVPELVWIVSLLGFSTIINYFGIETTARTNFVLLIVQLVILAVFMVIGTMAAVRGVGGAHLALSPLFNPALVTPGLIFGALALAVLSFLGFDAISTLSEEATGGAKAIGLATILSLCVSAVLFMAQTYLASLFVLGRTSFPAGAPTNEAFYAIAATIGGYWLKFLVAVPGMVIGVVAGALSAQAATARLLYSIARDGKLPRFLAHVQPVRKVPERAVFTVAIFTLALGIFTVGKVELLSSVVSFGALIGFLLLHASVIAHFRREGSRRWARHYAVPLIGLGIISYVLWNAEANAKMVGCAWLAAGILYYLVMRLRGRPAAVLVP
jgi:amino acid transporter